MKLNNWQVTLTVQQDELETSQYLDAPLPCSRCRRTNVELSDVAVGVGIDYHYNYDRVLSDHVPFMKYFECAYFTEKHFPNNNLQVCFFS